MSKKIKKGTPLFVIGTVLYGIVSIICIVMTIAAIDQANSYYNPQAEIMALILVGIFIAFTIWWISFAMAYRQRRTQIELLEEIRIQKLDLTSLT